MSLWLTEIFRMSWSFSKMFFCAFLAKYQSTKITAICQPEWDPFAANALHIPRMSVLLCSLRNPKKLFCLISHLFTLHLPFLICQVVFMKSSINKCINIRLDSIVFCFQLAFLRPLSNSPSNTSALTLSTSISCPVLTFRRLKKISKMSFPIPGCRLSGYF